MKTKLCFLIFSLSISDRMVKSSPKFPCTIASLEVQGYELTEWLFQQLTNVSCLIVYYLTLHLLLVNQALEDVKRVSVWLQLKSLMIMDILSNK